MFDEFVLGSEFFDGLSRADAEIAELVRQAGCPRCDGPLHRADYPRKPRGGAVARCGEGQETRISFCCGADGCRRRATPPSLRFLGRRVYIEACVVVATVVAGALGRAKEIWEAARVPPRTILRWRSWWATRFTQTSVFVEIAARFVGVDSELPGAVLKRMEGPSVERLDVFARWLAPLTTGSVPDGSRFVRGAA